MNTRSAPSRRHSSRSALERARVAVEVLGRTELQRVDEDRHEQVVGSATGRPQQRCVPLVQRAHGHDDGDAPGQSVAGSRELVPLRDDLHHGRTPPGAVARTASSAPARSGSRRPLASARSAVSRAMATYDGSTSGAAAVSAARWAATVPASPRATGPVSAASPRRRAPSSAAPSSGAEHRAGVLDAGPAQQVGRAGDEGRQVVGAVREGGVPQRPLLLGEVHRLATHLEHQGVAGRQQRLRGGDAECDADQALEVDGGAGEGQRRVQGERQRAGAQRGLAAPPTPCRPEVCASSAPRRSAPVATSPSTRPASASSGTVSSTRSACATTSSTGSTGACGSSAAARAREASDTAETATTG